ncbi:MAG: SIS domain-containing protein [Burkholderiales bacterium]|nr:SIS domain-containing protein [Burkholderiales bacterium]
MQIEARDSPGVSARLMERSGPAIQSLAAALRRISHPQVLTVARGSSDHAASHLAYLLLSRLGWVAASLPPSAVTLHQAPIGGPQVAALALSQSGQSPDLVAALSHLRARGALTAAFVNATASPLAAAAEHVVDLCAGPEQSVAATKSFIAELVAGLCLFAELADDDAVRRALPALPGLLQRAVLADWSTAVDQLRTADRLFVIGRGAGLAIAAEMALKFKEVCGIQAEAFSGAEVRHGPQALIEAGYPVLILAVRGPEQAGLLRLAGDLQRRGARILIMAPQGSLHVECPAATWVDIATSTGAAEGSAMFDAASAIQSFYLMVEALARSRGLEPDHPPHLAKVTRTT